MSEESPAGSEVIEAPADAWWNQRCAGCGYDLRATEAQGECPECGLAVETSKAEWLAQARGPLPGGGLMFLVIIWHLVAPAVCFAMTGFPFDIRQIDTHPRNFGWLDLVLGGLIGFAVLATFLVTDRILSGTKVSRIPRPLVGGLVLAVLLAAYYGAGLIYFAGPLISLGLIYLVVLFVVGCVAGLQWVILQRRHFSLPHRSHAAKTTETIEWLLVIASLLCLIPVVGWVAGLLVAPLMTMLTSLLVLAWAWVLRAEAR